MTGEDLLERARTDRRDLFNMERLKQGMAAQGLDGILAVSPVNVTYTGGVFLPIWPIRLQAFALTTVDGEQGVVINEATALCYRKYSWIEDIRFNRFTTSVTEMNRLAIEQLITMIKDKGLSQARLGIEKRSISAMHWNQLRKSLPKASLDDATDVFEYARLVKTPSEIELYRIAAYYTDKAISIAFASAKPGDSEKAVTSHMQAAVLQLGADDLAHAHLHSGLHSTIVHAWPLEAKRLEPGEVVHIDFGAIFGGYRTDVSRNAVVGSATQKQETIYRRLWEIEQLVFESMHPGVVAGELFDLAQQAFQKANLVYPWGTLGHSIGLMVHEGFEIVHGSEKILETGMLINIEPSHIEEGDARYHIEDTVLVTDDGIEVLSSFMPTESMFVIN